MTEEEIKQNAEVWAEEHKMRTDFGYGWPETYDTKQQADAYIAGAHSRDEEITRLSAEIEDDNYVISKLREELNRLRNPWISVEDETNRPEIGEQIIIAYDEAARNILKYTGKELFEIWNAHHWMHMPGLKKEDKNECK